MILSALITYRPYRTEYATCHGCYSYAYFVHGDNLLQMSLCLMLFVLIIPTRKHQLFVSVLYLFYITRSELIVIANMMVESYYLITVIIRYMNTRIIFSWVAKYVFQLSTTRQTLIITFILICYIYHANINFFFLFSMKRTQNTMPISRPTIVYIVTRNPGSGFGAGTKSTGFKPLSTSRARRRPGAAACAGPAGAGTGGTGTTSGTATTGAGAGGASGAGAAAARAGGVGTTSGTGTPGAAAGPGVPVPNSAGTSRPVRDKHVLSLYYQNCRGTRTKLHVLYMNILLHNYDIIVLTETWLHSGILDNEYIDSRYRVFRCDRDRTGSGKLDGGGVLVAVRRELPASVRRGPSGDILAPSPASPHVDHVLLELRARYYCCLLSASYIPPGLNADIYESHLNYLSSHFQSTDIENIIALGDYNLPTLEWRDCNTHMEPIIQPSQCLSNKHLIDFISSTSTLQFNNILNSDNRLLDLFMTDISECCLSPVSVPLVPIDIRHPAFYVLIPMNKQIKPCRTLARKQFNFGKADYALINSELSEINWEELFSQKSAEEAVSILYEVISSIIKNNIPTKLIKPSTYPCWFTLSLINIFKNKTNCWIKWKKYRNQSDKHMFDIYREKFKYESKKCYRLYIKNIEDNIKKNINNFWTYINSHKSKGDIPDSVSYNNKTSKDPLETCKLFSLFFKSTFEPSRVDSNLTFNSVDSSGSTDLNINIGDIEIPKSTVLKELLSLDTSKGVGLDGIPPIFLRLTAKHICDPLVYIFNLCLKEGIFPKVWKSARIVPVHKGGSRSDVENYRPISILPTLSKLFERLVHNILYPSLHKLIIEQQHGFVRHRSTVTNLVLYTTYIFENLDKNKQTDSVYTDFRKAFDRVDHKILLEKLYTVGIRGNLWCWFKSYISSRTQKVVINGYESEFVSISSGVPQGSILGPLLFVLFINDVHRCFKYCNFLLYADDLKIYHTINSNDDHVKFQQDLDRFSQYCHDNQLCLSLNKCKTIRFTKKRTTSIYPYMLCGTRLDDVESIRDLGVILDNKMHLDEHVEHIISKAFKMYGFVFRSCLKFSQPSTFIYIYKSLIRSQLEYAVPIWNPFYDKYIQSIESVQKKYLRRVHYKCYRSRLSYSNLLNKFKLTKLKSRRIQLEAMMLYDLCHNKYDCIPIHNMISYKVPHRTHNRRLHQLFATHTRRTNAGKRSPMHRLVYSYNTHFSSIDIFATRVSLFKKQILDILSTHD